jgi:hypothetical protein
MRSGHDSVDRGPSATAWQQIMRPPARAERPRIRRFPTSKSRAAAAQAERAFPHPRDRRLPRLQGPPKRPASVLQMRVHPADHGVVPLQTVGRFPHDVNLVREYEQPALDATPLQGRDGTDALRVRDAEVLLAVDDQHGRAPPGEGVRRVDALIALGIVVVGSAELPLREPQFLG